MGAARMTPITDKDGNLHPEQDHRLVPLSVMALYLGIHKATLHKRLVAGAYGTAGVVKMGQHRYFKPRTFMGIQ